MIPMKLRLAAALSFTACLTLVFVAEKEHHAPSREGREQIGEQEKKGERSAFLREYFYAQRLYGNPDVDVYQRLFLENQRYNANASMAKTALDGNVWTERGPWNIGGRIRGVAIHPSQPNVIFAGAASGGVWKSTNLGDSWTPVSDNAPVLPIGAIAIDPTNPNRIYAGTGEPDIFTNGRVNATPIWSTGIGLLKSEDGGGSWSTVTWASSTGGAHRIALHPAGDTILVATSSDLWKSPNGGASWSRAGSGIITDVVYKPGQPSRVYYATGNDNGGGTNGVYVSDAGGKSFTFRKLTTNFPAPDSCGRICLAISPANPDRIYAAVLRNRRQLGTNILNDFLMLLVSNNGGETWERKVNAINTSCTNGQGYFNFSFSASPADANVVLLGGLDVFRSTNGGQSFTRVSDWTRANDDPKYVHADIHHFAFQPGSATNVIAATDGGISLSTDRGTTWKRKIAKLSTIQYYSCAYDPSTPTSIMGGTQDNGTLGLFNNDNAAWYELFGGDGGSVAIDPQRNTVRYVNSTGRAPGGEVIRSIVRTGVGAAVQLANGLGAGATADYFTWVPALLFHPADRTRLYTATQYVYVMKNPDATTPPAWRIISPDLGQGFSIVTKLAVAPSNAEWMYAVTASGRVWLTKNLSATDPTWTMIASGLPNRWVTDICVDDTDPQTAWISLSGFGAGHVFKTANAGQNWANITNGLPDVPANAIVRSHADPMALFVATDIGVFYSSNGGTQWQRFGTGFPNVVAYDMKITPANTLVVGTHGRGMWTSSAILSVAGEEERRYGFGLESNYPSARSGAQTAIPFSLHSAGTVTLTLHDMSGRILAQLLNEDRSPGRHEIAVSLRGVPPGVYFYAMDFNGGRQTRKMIVL
ncbi:MAG: T9SS type A sorting domain-containing protein [Ignavibacteria bacterium]|nr:T9SS type A sorting domain-containing protein [Ignavibacteria bacterium]